MFGCLCCAFVSCGEWLSPHHTPHPAPTPYTLHPKPEITHPSTQVGVWDMLGSVELIRGALTEPTVTAVTAVTAAKAGGAQASHPSAAPRADARDGVVSRA